MKFKNGSKIKIKSYNKIWQMYLDRKFDDNTYTVNDKFFYNIDWNHFKESFTDKDGIINYQDSKNNYCVIINGVKLILPKIILIPVNFFINEEYFEL